MSTLGRFGTSSPSLDSLVSTALTTGIPALADMAVAGDPASRSHIPNGVRWDYGSGYTTSQGTFTGTVDLTYSNVQTSGNTISAQFNVQSTNFTKNGEVRPFDHATGTVSAQQGADGKTTGTVTLDGGGTITAGSGDDITDAAFPVTGTMQFDTARCAKYPIGGSVTMDYSALMEQPANVTTGTIAFDGSCDGTFQWTGPALLLAFAPTTAPAECPTFFGLAMLFDLISVTWNGATIQGSADRTLPDDEGVTWHDQTSMQGTLSADGSAVLTFQIDSHQKSTYPVGHEDCPAGGCTRELWASATLSNLPRSQPDETLWDWQSLSLFAGYWAPGTASITSWSLHQVGAGFPDSSDNYDCTYPIDQSKPNQGGIILLLAKP